MNNFLFRYTMALICLVVPVLIRGAMAPVVGLRVPYFLLLPAVLLATWIGGGGPGMLALIGGLLLGDYFFIPPYHQLVPKSAADTILITSYIITGLLSLLILQWLRIMVARSEKSRLLAETSQRHAEALEREINERQRVEEAFRQSEERYRRIVETAQEGIWCIDAQGKTTYVNSHMAEMLDYPPEEIVGQPLFKFIGETDWDTAKIYLKRRREGIIEEHDFRFRRKDGSALWTIVSANPIFEAGGKYAGAMGMLTDITARKKAEEQLQQVYFLVEKRHAELEAIFESMLHSVFIVNENGIVKCNHRACEMMGVPNAEELHRPLDDLVEKFFFRSYETGQRLKRHEIPSRRAFHGEKIVEELIMRKTSGEDVIVRISAAPIVHNKIISGAVIVALDVTDEKQKECALREAQHKLSQHAHELEDRVAERTASLQASIQALENLLYHVAHDLRAPLRAMEGFTAILLQDYSGLFDDTGKDCTRRISMAAQKMDSLIMDLLEYGRLNHLEMPLGKVDVEHCLADAISQLDDQIRSTHAEIRIEPPFPVVRANPVMLRQIFMNIIGNALKYVAPGNSPMIELWSEKAGKTVRIAVRDNGIGIDPQFHDRIFRVFERLHNERVYSGTGIGLAIVRKGIERLGGKVTVDSKLGNGSTFWIELPACAADDNNVATPSGQPVASA